MPTDVPPPFTPEQRERRKLRLAMTLQTVALVLMAGSCVTRALAVGVDAITVILGVVAVLFAVVLAITVTGYRRVSA